MTTHIFYHSADLDGHCSGAIARLSVETYCENAEIKMWSIDYGDLFPWHAIEPDDVVVMVDYSLPPGEEGMDRLAQACKRLTWIDHHKTAIKDYQENKIVQDNVWGKREVGKAACELAWEYFFPDKEMPFAVTMLGRWDVWDLEHSRFVVPFQYGMRNRITHPNDVRARDLWESLLGKPGGLIEEILVDGNKRVADKRREVDESLRDLAFEAEIDGEPVTAINRRMGSLFCDAITDHGVLATFVRRANKKWTVTLYSNCVDVSAIAKRMGGGGHENAAGFVCETLPF